MNIEEFDQSRITQALRKVINFWILLLMITFLNGLSCVREMPAVKSPVKIPAEFSTSGDGRLTEKWWLSFDDPVLHDLIDRVLENNLNIQIAWTRLTEAKAIARMEGSELWPSLDFSTDTDVTLKRGGEITYGLFLGLASSYEVDLWGRIDSVRKAAELDVEASEADLRAVAISLIAEIALAWYELVETRALVDLLEEQLETNRKLQRLIELRYKYGKAKASDVLRQMQVLESTKSELIKLRAKIALLLHRLAVLLGESPTENVVPEVAQLPILPQIPNTGLPLELLQRRPDVRAAYLRVCAMDERVAIAIAEQYPRLIIGLSLGLSTEEISTIFTSWMLRLVAGLTVPLIDGGRRRAEVERRRAVSERTLYEYGKTILNALLEVEDALSELKWQQKLVESLESQVDLAAQVDDRLRDSYAKGGVSYLEVIEALRRYQALEKEYLSAKSDLLVKYINLYRALGGEWTPRDPSLRNDPQDSRRLKLER